jgi:RNA polymerase sigma-B factor
MHRGNEPLEDLVQVACEGLIKAVDRFDPARGVPFEAFARPCIVGSLKRHYRDRGWAIRMPRRVHDLAPLVRDGNERLEQQLGRPPTEAELADHLDLSVASVRKLLVAQRARAVTSLDAPAPESSTTGHDRHGRPDPGYDRCEQLLDLRDGLRHLPDDDIDLLRKYYVEEQTQSAIAATIGVSQMQISRRLRAITNRLHEELLAS